jgi:carbon storage regulator
VLVVTRKRNESIVIGDGIEVRVLRTGREGVKLGVSAPPHVSVHRKEIYDQICQANASAAEGARDMGRLADRLRSSVAALRRS